MMLGGNINIEEELDGQIPSARDKRKIHMIDIGLSIFIHLLYYISLIYRHIDMVHAFTVSNG